jgi:SAM-dependent methyltransferase
MPYLGQRIADVGCGLGSFVDLLKDRKFYLGVEPDRELIDEFVAIHHEKNVSLAINGDICSDNAVDEIKAAKIDTIICINVLEHIYDDKLALVNMTRGVNSGGHICVLVPALPLLYGSLDELDKHYRRYTKNGLHRLISNLDVEVIKCHYLNCLGAFGWFIKGRILKDRRSASSNYVITNALLPIVSLIEGIVKPPFGLSLVIVLKKK